MVPDSIPNKPPGSPFLSQDLFWEILPETIRIVTYPRVWLFAYNFMFLNKFQYIKRGNWEASVMKLVSLTLSTVDLTALKSP